MPVISDFYHRTKDRFLGWRQRRREARAGGSGQVTLAVFEQELLQHDPTLWEVLPVTTPVPDEAHMQVWKRTRRYGQAECMKFQAFFPRVTPDRLVPLLSDPSCRHWDPNYVVFEPIERYAPNRWAVYSRSFVPKHVQMLGVKAREYVLMLTLRSEPDKNRHVVTATSTEHPARPTVAEGAVRGQLHYQGVLIEPAVYEDTGTQVTVYGVNDIKLSKAVYWTLQPVKNAVLRRWPPLWYFSLSKAVGCSVEAPYRFYDSETAVMLSLLS